MGTEKRPVNTKIWILKSSLHSPTGSPLATVWFRFVQTTFLIFKNQNYFYFLSTVWGEFKLS